MKCKYCFANFSNIKKSLSKVDWFEIIRQLTDFGMKKVNFVGGEPTLCPFLGELFVFSKKLGLITGIVSNGTGITQLFIEKFGKFINWIGLSLDSGNELTQKTLGRGKGNYVRSIINKSIMIKRAGLKLKINSVITHTNFNENMSKMIENINPDRWKIFQALEIEEQNSSNIKTLLISKKEFEQFVERHQKLNPIVENNDAMIESYIMIDPLGRFFQNSDNFYAFSRPILKVGIFNALNDIQYNHSKFIKRGGLYALS